MDLLSSLAELMFAANLRAVVAALGVVVAMGIFGPFLTAHWRGLLWLLVFIPLAVPVAPRSGLSLHNLFAGTNESRANPVPAQRVNVPRALTPSPIGPASSANLKTPRRGRVSKSETTGEFTFSWRSALVIAWLVGAALLTSRLIFDTWRLSRRLGRLPGASRSIQDILRSCAAEIGRHRAPRAVVAADDTGPAIAGFINPVLILPAHLADSLPPERLRLILLHELRHARCGDLPLNWLLNLLKALNWWNPAVWLTHHQWRSERELACDAWVMSHAGPGSFKPYAETLLKITELADDLRFPLTAGTASPPSLTERRILAMKMPREATWAGFIIGCCLVGVIAAVGLTNRARGDGENRAHSKGAATNTPEEVDFPSLRNPDGTALQLDPTVKPIIVFTKHLILWGPRANEAITWEEMDKRLTRLAAKGPVHPQFQFTNGSKFSSGAGFQEIQDRILKSQLTGELPKFDAVSFGSVAPAAGERLDQIETPEELKPDPADRLTGQVLQPDGESPAAGAQVIVIAPEVGNRAPLPVTLVDGQLRNPVDELWAPTDGNGEFTIYPESNDRAMTILHPGGFLFIPAPIDRMKKTYTLVPWATIRLDASKLADNERVSLRIHPKGAEETAGFTVNLSEHRQEGISPTVMKLPPGQVRVSRGIELDQGSTFLKITNELSLQPGETSEYRIPVRSAEEREREIEQFRQLRRHNAKMLDLREESLRQEQRQRIKRAQDKLSR